MRGSPSAFDAWWHANNPLLGLHRSTGVKAHVAGSCGCKAVGLRCSQGFARSTGDVRQPGMVWFQVAIQAVDWFVPEQHLLV